MNQNMNTRGAFGHDFMSTTTTRSKCFPYHNKQGKWWPKKISTGWTGNSGNHDFSTFRQEVQIGREYVPSKTHSLTMPATDEVASTSIDCICEDTNCKSDVTKALQQGFDYWQQPENGKTPVQQGYHWGGYGSVPVSHLHTMTNDDMKYKAHNEFEIDPGVYCHGGTQTVRVSGVCVPINIKDGKYDNIDDNARFICENRHE